MSYYEQKTQELLKGYQKAQEKSTPEWAVHKKNTVQELVKCTIPFVGKHYFEQPVKILVYASAENLSGYYIGNTKEWIDDWLDDDSQAENRHRKCFDESIKVSDSFFPHVHLAPINYGLLSTAVYYIASKLQKITTLTPAEFYETIAFANYGKYSIETEHQRNLRVNSIDIGSDKNIDYTKLSTFEACEKLSYSLPLLQVDVEILKPDVIILPSSLYNINKDEFNIIRKDIPVIKIYQLNAQTVHQTIAKKYPTKPLSELPASLKEWINHLSHVSKKHYLSVFSYLDNVIEPFIQ